MTEPSPTPACLSHLTQRDAAVRSRALREAALRVRPWNWETPSDWTCHARDAMDHFERILALIPTPPAPAPAPDEAAIRASGPFTSAIFNKADAARNAALRENVNDHISALGDAFNVVRQETLNEQAAIRAELVAEYRRLMNVCDDLIRGTTDPGSEAFAAIYCSRAILARADATPGEQS